MSPVQPHPALNPFARLLLFATILGLSASARADTLTLKNGTVINGTYLNSTGESLRFQTVTGYVETIPAAEVLSLTTSPGTAAVAPAAAAPYAPTVTNITIPAGTVLLVQMMDGVSAKSEPGTVFTTKLQYDLVANGVVAARAGTIAYGKILGVTQAGPAVGKSTLDLRLTQMVANGIPVPLLTGSFTPHVEPAGKKAAAGEGAASLYPGPNPSIPAGALLEFTLQQPATVSMVR